MKVYAVIVEPEEWGNYIAYKIIGIYKNEDDANDKLADIMQDIEAYSKTYIPKQPNESNEDFYKRHRLYSDNFPHTVGDEWVDVCYVKEFELL
jgi:hypothetical protein